MTTTARVQAGRLADLLRRERAEMAEFLLALAEFDEQRGWLELGYSSLFYFLHRELGLSRGGAHCRKTAAGLARRFPEIIEPLRDGRLCFTSVVEVAKVLTAENRHEVLPKFFQRSKREAMALAAALRGSAATAESCLDVTVPRRFLDKLDAARTALSLTQHGATAESILEAGLDLVLKRHAGRTGLAETPRAETAAARSPGGIPEWVKREVWKRDGGRCQWPLDSGGVCESSLQVECDHIIPRALGGSSAPGNLRLFCRFHNDAAKRGFGAEGTNQFTDDPARPKRPGAS
ncbi:MAG: HNH endonuclease [Deltaproteobacteria bacterium]